MEITRTAYCPHCYSKRKPKVGNEFFLFGGSGNVYLKKARIYEGCEHGYTPHLFKLINATDKGVEYEKTCLMVGCGIKKEVINEIDYRIGQETHTITPIPIRTDKEICSIRDWNALVSRWKETDYEI